MTFVMEPQGAGCVAPITRGDYHQQGYHGRSIGR
jgi:hypothetical protein